MAAFQPYAALKNSDTIIFDQVLTISGTTYGQTAIVIISNSDLSKFKTPNLPCCAENSCFLVWLRLKDYVTIDKQDYLENKWFT